jgi:prepilin-type N-terminal cleavage/methylation domain-containing protein
MLPRAGNLRPKAHWMRRSRAVPGAGARGPRAFSLAELMIALAVLGMGLLVIGAALPVGVRYTRDSVNLAAGQAAAQYALDLIEENVALPKRVLDASGDVVRETGVFQPRDIASVFQPTHEPLIKVRPLYTQAISTTPGSIGSQALINKVHSEELLRTWLGSDGADPLECDHLTGGLPWMRPALPSVALCYPPVTPDVARTVGIFYANMYQPRYVWTGGEETIKVLRDRNIVWTAFYRRASYGPGSDPYLYEFIVVTSRVNAGQRFPVQALGSKFASRSPADNAGTMLIPHDGSSTAAPTPWLMEFLSWSPVPQLNIDYREFPDPASGLNERLLATGAATPAKLTFVASAAYGPLLPPGSVIIPAVNDYVATKHPAAQMAGFVPSAPDALPIYEVTGQTENANGNYTISVNFNGYYPWVDGSSWPVWIVPPACEYDDFGNPLPPQRSSVLSVARRYIRLREVP